MRIHNLVRAVARPWPGAFTFADGRRLLIWRARPYPAAASGAAGIVLGPSEEGVVVACGDGTLLVLEAQTEAGQTDLSRALPRGTRLG